MYNILLKDVFNNTEYVLNSFSFQDHQLVSQTFQDFYNIVKTKHNGVSLNIDTFLSSDNHLMYCEIYEDRLYESSGWFWNSLENIRHVYYLLRVVPVFFQNEGKEHSDASCQTDNQRLLFDTSCQTDNQRLLFDTSCQKDFYKKKPDDLINDNDGGKLTVFEDEIYFNEKEHFRHILKKLQ